MTSSQVLNDLPELPVRVLSMVDQGHLDEALQGQAEGLPIDERHLALNDAFPLEPQASFL